MEYVIRFLIGGVAVSAFAVLGDAFRPKSFAGLFGAAPSIALATLALAIAQRGNAYAAIEARSMMLGAIALWLYSSGVCYTDRQDRAKQSVRCRPNERCSLENIRRSEDMCTPEARSGPASHHRKRLRHERWRPFDAVACRPRVLSNPAPQSRFG
jgi:hypothetical protein